MEGKSTGVEMWGTYQGSRTWRLSGGFSRLRERLTLKPGSVYRVKLSYLTKNDAIGGLVVQTQDYKGVASARLTTTAVVS